MRKLPRNTPSSARGITLLELMITLSIVVVVVVLLASSNFTGLLDKTQLDKSASFLVGNIQLARSESVERNMQVGLCASDDGATCSGTPDNGWKAGFIMFTDPNRNSDFDGDPEILLRVGDAMSDKQEVTASNHTLIFSPDGSVDGISSVSTGDGGGDGTIGDSDSDS